MTEQQPDELASRIRQLERDRGFWRQVSVGLAVALLLCLVASAVAVGRSRRAVRRDEWAKADAARENFRRLREGMTQDEAERILGIRGRVLFAYTDGYSMVWEGEHYSITIEFSGVEGSGAVVNGWIVEGSRPVVEWWTARAVRLRQHPFIVP